MWTRLGAQDAVFGFGRDALPQRLAQIRFAFLRMASSRWFSHGLDKVARTAAHRLDGNLDAAPGGHHDNGHRDVES